MEIFYHIGALLFVAILYVGVTELVFWLVEQIKNDWRDLRGRNNRDN